MEKNKIWPVALETLMALGAHYVPAMEKAADDAGVERGVWGLLISALTFEPKSISNAQLQRRNPYQNYARLLADAAGQGFFEIEKRGHYRLTDLGHTVGQEIILAAYARMQTFEPLRVEQMQYLSVLLRKLVIASHTSPEPPGKWSLTHARRIDPGQNAPLIIQVDQYLSDLAAYRDDAHLAAWRALDFDGPTWETFTLLWRGEVDDLDTLLQKLKYRRFPRKIYATALQKLEARNLIVSDSGKYRVTLEGEQLRQKAEETTDAYFYPPWNCLDAEELEALEVLLGKLAEEMGKKRALHCP
jgi:predicted transcriptional regulator